MIYITAKHPHETTITMEVLDAKLVPDILKMLIKQGYDMLEIKGWQTE